MSRSIVQAIGVLIFMFHISWQLSIVAFVSVPLITILSKWYGNYIRSLTKVMQIKLADGNLTCDVAISSMTTVRAFDATENVLKEF
jgi:ABC-type multidrug transport system fused ATPase/permease subunit